MKNICFLIGDLNHSGGTERVTTLIANNLAEQGDQIYILSLSHGNKPFFELHPNILNNALFHEKVSMRRNFFEAIKKIRKFILDHNIDSFVVVDSISCVFTVPACIGLKVKHICWEHFNLKVNLGSRFRDVGRWLAAKYCDQIITLTERDKTFWDAKYQLKASGKVIAIPNPSPYELQDNLPSLDDKTILCVGRLTHQKGFDLLISAWAKIASQLPGWKVVIVGNGEDEQKLKLLAEQHQVSDSIIFAGQQKNMDKFYRQASFFCMSSRFEGLPMVLLEAQSYGLPIVAFDCDTGPAEIIDNGENGYLVKSFDLDYFSINLKDMIFNQKYKNFVHRSFETAKKFRIQEISKKWCNIVGEGSE
ncbi:glycosyltransferase family 4 protein [Acinetobacter guillouiae]|uniref:glycosyltransferase family 4 protein n=1 Tax=Acinetobacter guillouiae TaxID=106649 RepID=UPI003CFF6BCA